MKSQLEKDVMKLGDDMREYDSNIISPLLTQPVKDKISNKEGVYFLGSAGSTPSFIFHTIDHLKKFTHKNHKYVSAVAGFIISLNNTRLLVDPGPHFTEQIRDSAVDPRWVNAIVVSHVHSDHMFSMGDFEICTSRRKNSLDLISNHTVIEGFRILRNDRVVSIIPKHLDYFHEKMLKSKKGITLTPGRSTKINNVKIKAVHATDVETSIGDKHLCNSLGFIFSSKGKSIGYFADSTPYLLKDEDRAGYAKKINTITEKPKLNKKLIKEYAGVDVLIINIGGALASKKNPYRKMGAQGAIDVINYLKSIKKAPKLVILNHWWYHMGMHNKDIDKIYKREKVTNFKDLVAKYVKAETKVKTIASHDLTFLQMNKNGFSWKNPY